MYESLLIILIILIGVFAGTLTGLIPGLHINMIATLSLVFAPILLSIFEAKIIVVFLLSMGIVHSFVNVIPTLLLGVPQEDNVLTLLPAQRMLERGEGVLGLYLSSFGSLFGLIISGFVGVVLLFFLDKFYQIFEKFIAYVLIFVIFFLILNERKIINIFWALVIVVLSGSFGILLLSSYHLEQNLFVIFSGLFAIPALLVMYFSNSKIPIQKENILLKFPKKSSKGLFFGMLGAVFCSVSPGLGASQAATLISVFFRDIKSDLFLIVSSSLNTIIFAISLFSFYLIDKSRNGIIVTISQFTRWTFFDLIFYFFVLLIAGIIGVLITFHLGKFLLLRFVGCSLEKLSLFILIALSIVVFIVSSWYGLFVFFTLGFLGLFAQEMRVSRVHLMSVLLIPVILFFI